MEFETTKRINEWLKEFGVPQIPAELKTGTAAEVTGQQTRLNHCFTCRY